MAAIATSESVCGSGTAVTVVAVMGGTGERGRRRRVVERAEQRHVVVIDKTVVVKVAQSPCRLCDARGVICSDNRHVIVVNHTVKRGIAGARNANQD